jgi:hypothetical protein
VIEIGDKQGRTLAESIAVIANARIHLGIDSFGNHLTNYLWYHRYAHEGHKTGNRVPGVILWGSTQWSGSGYPTNINLSAGFACQPCFKEDPALTIHSRGVCINPPRATYEDDTPHGCMAALSVDSVVESALSLWETTGTSA